MKCVRDKDIKMCKVKAARDGDTPQSWIIRTWCYMSGTCLQTLSEDNNNATCCRNHSCSHHSAINDESIIINTQLYIHLYPENPHQRKNGPRQFTNSPYESDKLELLQYFGMF